MKIINVLDVSNSRLLSRYFLVKNLPPVYFNEIVHYVKICKLFDLLSFFFSGAIFKKSRLNHVAIVFNWIRLKYNYLSYPLNYDANTVLMIRIWKAYSLTLETLVSNWYQTSLKCICLGKKTNLFGNNVRYTKNNTWLLIYIVYYLRLALSL